MTVVDGANAHFKVMTILKPSKSAAEFVPQSSNLRVLKQAALHCEGCDLYRHASQTVFGEGTKNATIMFVGEQPGDQEDKFGEPFVGPAGRLLDVCLEEAGIDRKTAYVTNAVKHFKWEPRGKRRIHKKPSLREIRACHPWLAVEIEVVHPKLIVCLGATAAQSLLGPAFRVSQDRGKVLSPPGHPPLIATVHPSSILRARIETEREEQKRLFVQDLLVAAKAISTVRTF